MTAEPVTEDQRLGSNCKAGDRVRFAPSDSDDARAAWGSNKNPGGLLNPALTYEIERVEVHSWHTKLWLKDAGGPFNSAHFVAAEPSTERTTDDEPFAWGINEYGLGVNQTTYSVDTPFGVIYTTNQGLAEDIATLPVMKRELARLLDEQKDVVTAPGLVPVRRSEDDRLESICQLLEELLAEVRRGNAVERTGAVSSVEVKFLANGTPQPVLKAYAGSEVPVDEALEAYGRLVREANERAMNGWAETVEALKA